MKNYDITMIFDSDDAENLVGRIMRLVPHSNFVLCKPIEDLYTELTGELKAFLAGVEFCLGRDTVIDLLKDVAMEMFETVFSDEIEEPEDDEDDDLDDDEDFEDDEEDVLVFIHDEDSFRPMGM